MSGVTLLKLTLTEVRKICLERDLPITDNKSDLILLQEEKFRSECINPAEHRFFISRSSHYRDWEYN